MGEIFLIRHGQASFGEQVYDKLSPLGIAQSRRLGQWLAAQDLAFDAVYAGERVRQQDTARLALAEAGRDAGIRVESCFNELDADRLLQHAIPRVILRDPSVATLLMDIRANRDAFRHVFERIVDEWVEGEWQEAGIGDWPTFSGTVLDGLRALARRHGSDRRIAVFTSGGPITATMQLLAGEARRGLDWEIANTSITRVGYDGNGALALLERRVLPHLEGQDELVSHL